MLALPATVIYFVTYEQLRSRLNNFANSSRVNFRSSDANLNLSSQPSWVPLIAGCTARVWSVVTVSPLELIRTKMQSERLNYLRKSPNEQLDNSVKVLLRLFNYHGKRYRNEPSDQKFN